MGSLSSSSRTADQTLACLFWNGYTPRYWNRIAVSLGAQRHTTLSENARLLALLNIAMAVAAIACWEAKYHYVFWRPVTAIPLAATDGNPATIEDPTWTPLLVTPAHPEYPFGPFDRQWSGGLRARELLWRIYPFQRGFRDGARGDAFFCQFLCGSG
jgi:hypothetical protein